MKPIYAAGGAIILALIVLVGWFIARANPQSATLDSVPVETIASVAPETQAIPVLPTDTPIPPTGTPTSVPPTATATATSADGIWTARADMPTGRWELSTSVVDGKIYAFGGAGPAWQALGSVEEYDPATDTWTTKSEMPTARQGLSTSVVNGKIYAIGGGVGTSATYGSVETYSTVEEYDPATDTWTTKSEMPTSRGFHSANVVDGKIYVIGGSHEAIYYHGVVATVEVYDPATDTWTQKGDMPRGIGAGYSSVVDGKIYVFGGYVFSDRVDEYDPATDTWTQKSNMPTKKRALTTSALDGKIYVIGGYVPGVPDYQGVATVEVYDPTTDTWTTAPDMPTGRFGPRSSVVDGKIYVIGGMEYWVGSAKTTVEEYDPE
jgi:N-acetylneuraminic acid mutarotase